ncbi:hypothetical protein CYY_008573 [Polysphondylium violaceum]|uniref:Serine/threonine-protein phosphatase 2A activator n=1 Tax=Polysphondylium violaceum TaxID=133409 RepID=A0A8J4UWU5_9MYCE|nr:hypothetical protein CYY_008573 [Polysphondylium violaceum]
MNIKFNSTTLPSSYNHFETISKLTRDALKANDEPTFINFNEPQIIEFEKRISGKRDLECFHTSSTYDELLNFIVQLSVDTQGKSLTTTTQDESHISDAIKSIEYILDQLDRFVNEIPPKPVRTRFGNESFVEWFDRIQIEIPNLLIDKLNHQQQTPLPQYIINEISGYLGNSFGDRSRIDYGSGHELNFICFLLSLVKIKFLTRKDYQFIIIKLFYKYLNLMRKLQETYWLEPAGSHGVWGLDDYHFLPFLFGSSQLIEHKYIRPKSIRNQEIVNSAFSSEYMYLGCIQFISKVKSGGSLLEHSPMLVDISGVKNWSKVNEGMIKMYKNEVLSKLPIMQHFLFGSILPFIDNPQIPYDPIDEENDKKPPHPHTTAVHSFSSCGCITRVPSVFAANSFNQSVVASTSNTTSNSENNVVVDDGQDCCANSDSNDNHHHQHQHHQHNQPHPPRNQKVFFPLD